MLCVQYVKRSRSLGIRNAMALRQLSKTHFLPEEVQEVIWGFGWHLNLGVITVLQCVVEGEDQAGAVHHIYRVFVKNLPVGIDRRAYMAFLGIPWCFDAVGKPKVWVYPPFAELGWDRVVIWGQVLFREVYGYDTFAGVETWAGCQQEIQHYDSWDDDDSDDG